jgi:response regulator RpfG family c-di-GMP phosphodiesterase
MKDQFKDSIYNLTDLENEELSESEHAFRIDLISIVSETLAEMAELKDRETGHHINRVAIIGTLIANDLIAMRDDVDDQFVKLLRFSISLHDIGKVAIEDHILLKPGKLTESEFLVMQKHALIGANILKNLHERIRGYGIEYFHIAMNIAKFHHEKFDGSGYPFGLKGDQIPIEAQITALVDVFDALMSKRPYKEAYPPEECFEIIVEGSGSHFNPIIVDILFKNQDRVLEIYNLLKN